MRSLVSRTQLAKRISVETENYNNIGQQVEIDIDLMKRENVSLPRPTTLLLEDTAKMILQDTTNSTHNNVRRRKKKRASERGVKTFNELYQATGESLGEGSFGSVLTHKNIITDKEFAVKIIDKTCGRSRQKVLKEVEIFHHCRGHDNILQLIEYFEEDNFFYLVFEKMEGGTLLANIENRGHLTEQEASLVVRDIAKALHFLHDKGMAHRDLKPENVLCAKTGQLVPLKICDFDLGSGIIMDSKDTTPVTTPELQTPVGSAEFMAPEVVDVWTDQAWSYDKRCDLWSLGIILYIMLCGYPPFYGKCGEDCGWERGEACHGCQDMLFNSIQDGLYDFPEEEWQSVSDDAKDLIRHLLVRDPHLRYSAAEVLRHPWVSMESPKIQLATPQVLSRANSVKELEAFAENAVAVNRMILRHLSISEAFAPPVFNLANAFQDYDYQENTPHFTIGDDNHDISHQELQSSGESDTENSSMWIGLSPPGTSSLARRRALGKSESSEDKKPKIPPKVPSAIF